MSVKKLMIFTTVAASMMVMAQSAFANANRPKIVVDSRNNGGAKSTSSIQCSKGCDVYMKS